MSTPQIQSLLERAGIFDENEASKAIESLIASRKKVGPPILEVEIDDLPDTKDWLNPLKKDDECVKLYLWEAANEGGYDPSDHGHPHELTLSRFGVEELHDFVIPIAMYGATKELVYDLPGKALAAFPVLGYIGAETEEQAKAFAEEYNRWIRGEFYRFRIYQATTCGCCGAVTEETLDSCTGFYSREEAQEAGEEALSNP